MSVLRYSLFVNGLANKISFFRLLLVPIVLFLPSTMGGLIVRIPLLWVIFLLDIVDGYVARRLGLANSLGGFIDILVDRIIDLSFWVFFTVVIKLPIFFSLAIILRISIVDSVRLHLAMAGYDQKSGIFISGWRKKLVASKLSKGGYNALKMLLFSALLVQTSNNSFIETPWLYLTMLVLVVFSLVRGIPILLQYVQTPKKNILNSTQFVADNYVKLYAVQLGIDILFLLILALFSL